MEVGLVVAVRNNISALCISGNDDGNDTFTQIIIQLIECGYGKTVHTCGYKLNY